MSTHCLRLLTLLLVAAGSLGAQQEPLRVLRHVPSDTASPGNIVSVTFDRPVAGRLDATVDARQIFHIQPVIAGVVAWRDPITIRFIPDAPLPPGSTFHITIDAGFRAIDGSTLAETYKFSFRVPGTRLLARSFGGDYSDNPAVLPVDGKLQLLYSAPVDVKTLAHVRLELDKCDRAERLTVPLRVALQRPPRSNDPYPFQGAGGWDRDTVGDRYRRVVELEPSAPLPNDCPGHLVLPNTADDAHFGAEERFAIRTAPTFHMKEFDCARLAHCSPVDLRIAFTAPAKREDLQRYVHLEPRVPLDFEGLPAQVSSLLFKVRLTPRSTYRVTVDSALRDIYGRRLQPPYSAEVVIGDYEPTIGYAHGMLTVPRSEPTLPVRHVNVRQIRIISFAIPETERPRILAIAPTLAQLELQRGHWLSPETTLVTLPGTHNVEELTQVALPPSVIGPRLSAVRLEIAQLIVGKADSAVPASRGMRITPFDPSPYAILQVTNLAAQVKLAPGEGTVLVTGLTDGQPRAGVSVRQLDDSGRAVAVGTTGSDGVASFASPRATPIARQPISNDWPPRVGIIEASLGDDRVLLPLTARSFGYEAYNPLQPWRLGASLGVVPVAIATVFADRDIYRPGEMVYLEGVVRDLVKGMMRLPLNGDSVRTTVTYRPSPWNTNESILIRDTVLRLNDLGTATDSFRLRAGSALGFYLAEFHLRRDGAWQVVASQAIRVAEYRAPEFLVSAAADTGVVRLRDTLHVRVSAKYLFGAPMGKARVDWQAILREAKPWEIRIPGAQGWTVGVWDWINEDPSQNARGALGGVDTLQVDGTRTLSILLSTLKPSLPGHVDVQIGVTDLNRQFVTTSAAAAVHGADLYILARHHDTKHVATIGEPEAIDLRTVRPDGAAAHGAPVVVTVVHRVWSLYVPTGYEGHWTDQPVRTDTVHSVGDTATYSFVPKTGGWYLFRLTADDGEGGVARTTMSSYVMGAGTRWAVSSPFHLPLVIDGAPMAIGSQARVMFDSPFSEAEALVTVERDGVIEQRRLTVHGGSNVLTFNVTDRYLPNVYVGVLLVKSGKAAAERPDSASQMIRVGYARIGVKTESKRLAVDVVPNAHEWRPGDTAAVQVHVRDASGHGARSQVTLWAVDEGVLALTGYGTPDILARMYAPRGLGVGLWSTLPLILTKNPGLLVELIRMRGLALSEVVVTSTASATVAQAPSQASFRSRFRSTAFFVGSAITNSAGDANVRARVPDNLTTYRIMAVAVSADDHFGSGESSMLVTRPLVARSTLPRFVRPGDSLVAGTVVNARDGQSRGVTVDATSEGIRLQGDARRQITLEQGRGGEARFSLIAPPRDSAPDSVTIRLHASDGKNADGIQLRLPVKPDFTARTHVAIGVVRDTTTVIIPLPADIDGGRSRLSLRLGTSPLPAMLAAYDWLRVYPYDCSEQIASNGRSLLAVWRATRNTNPKALGGDPRPRLQELVDELARRQRDDGAIRYWFDNPWSSPWLSTYAGLFLLEARDAGIIVDSLTIVRLGRYLHTVTAVPVDTGGMNRNERRARRLALGERVAAVEYLRRAGMPDLDAENTLLQLAFMMTWEDRLRLAEALATRAEAHDAAVALVDAAWKAVTPAGNRVDLPDSVHAERAFPSRVAPVARLLTASLALRPDQPLLGGLVESVLWLGRAEGRWAWSTQDYSAVVLALAALPHDENHGGRIIVSAQGRDVLVRPLAESDSTASVPLTGLLERGQDGRSQLRLHLTSDAVRHGATYFAVSVEEVPSKAPVTPDIKGIVVERWYERFDNGKPVTMLQAGDLVRVRLRVTVPADRAFVAVEDPLPAGLEAVDLSLRTSSTLAPFVTSQSEQAQQFGDRDRDGPRWQSWLYGSWDDGWWSPWEHKSMHDDRVVYFARMLWTGSYTASYVARATTSGSFVRPPAHAEEMYNPGVQGRSDGGRFEVGEARP